MEAFPFQSNFLGFDEAGNPKYDRAVGAEFMRDREKLFYTNGIFANPSDNFQVLNGTGMQIKVRPGTCFIEGVTGIEIEETTLPVSTAEELTARTDIVVLRCDFVNRWIELAVKTGTTELTRTGNIYELKIAEITVPKMAIEIAQSNITDTRLSAECGRVVNTIEHLDTETLFNEYYARWQEVRQLMAENEAAYNLWYEGFKSAAAAALQERYDDWDERIAAFDSWFDYIKASVSEAQYFDFDNPTYKGGLEYSYTEAENPTVYTEYWKTAADGSIYATRTSTANTDETQWTVVTVCETLGIHNTVVWAEQADGTWKGGVSNGETV